MEDKTKLEVNAQALALVGINAPENVLYGILLTLETVKVKGADFSIADAKYIQAEMDKKYPPEPAPQK